MRIRAKIKIYNYALFPDDFPDMRSLLPLSKFSHEILI